MIQINIPLHSAIEVFGSFAAITTAIILILLQKKRQSASQSIWVACGLLGMGILDVFHGSVAPGSTFVWLHSTANLLGGFLFMFAWLQAKNSQASFAPPAIVALAAMLFGAFSVAFPETLPSMIEQGEFTAAANMINFAGGLFFLIAAPRFFIGYRTGGHKDDLLFFIICIFLGLAEVLFQYSKAWDSTWWAWHFMRLSGLTIVLLYTFVIFKRFITVIAEAVSGIATTATQIAATVTQHERTASQQAVAANQTSATLTELSASSRQSAEQAANAAAVAEKASAATTHGGDVTRQAVAAMGDLKDKIAAMADQILRLGEQTGQIGSIAVLVKDLSGQINMLALNAAVEAARAGEHGKGFAVVAGEVRKLAGQSKKSAEQASALVADIQKATNSSIMMTEEGTRTVNEVTQLAQKVAELFNNLSGMAGSVNENAQQVMLNAKQQSAAFTQIVEATNNIAAGAKETAAGISQTKVGVQKLNEAAENLKAIA